MSVTITLPDGLGERIRVEAAREGLLVDEFVGRELQNRLVQARAVALSESTLLQKIGEGFPEVFWTRYRFLRGRLNQGLRHQVLRSLDCLAGSLIGRWQ